MQFPAQIYHPRAQTLNVDRAKAPGAAANIWGLSLDRNSARKVNKAHFILEEDAVLPEAPSC